MMKKAIKTAMLFCVTLALTACGFGSVETGQVGVVTSFNGKTSAEEIGPGMYFQPFAKVRHFTVKETSVPIQNLTPKASDNLKMKDVDVTIFYTVDPNKVAEFSTAFASQSARMQNEDFFRPGYSLIDTLARGAISAQVFKHSSMKIGGERDTLEAEVKAALEADLPKEYGFKVTRVVVSSLLPDDSIEESIRRNVAKDNELSAATKEVQVKDQLAQANVKLASSLTPALLQHEYIDALKTCAQRAGCTMLVGLDKTTPIVNLPKN